MIRGNGQHQMGIFPALTGPNGDVLLVQSCHLPFNSFEMSNNNKKALLTTITTDKIINLMQSMLSYP